jgi:surface polysaccharide O-acyltransferase-like enzyme
MPPLIPGTKSHIEYLKGLAILAVVVIHLINVFISRLTPHSSGWNLLVISDQITRFSVPLFIALSGFALAQKYASHPPSFWQFLTRRSLKLLPPYLLWSAVYVLAALIVPAWSTFSGGTPVWEVVLFGKAQYHLYFVPMLFQAYLLFPLLFPFSRKNPLAALALSFAIQFVSFRLTSGAGWNDQRQYLLVTSWIFYFVMGLVMNAVHSRIKYVGILLALGGLFWSVSDTFSLLDQGRDLIWSARFTRFPVWAYSLGFILFTPLLTGAHMGKPFRRAVSYLGANSYLIYLSHVLFLQLLTLVI